MKTLKRNTINTFSIIRPHLAASDWELYFYNVSEPTLDIANDNISYSVTNLDDCKDFCTITLDLTVLDIREGEWVMSIKNANNSSTVSEYLVNVIEDDMVEVTSNDIYGDSIRFN